MSKIIKIINEEIMTSVANHPQFGDRLNLQEIGDGSGQPYQYQFQDVGFKEVEYSFTTEDGDDYIVEVVNVDVNNRVWEMMFQVVGGGHGDVVDKGKIFQVMATILQISNEFIGKYKPNILKFKPSKNEEGEEDPRRFKLYMSYVQKNITRDYFAFEYFPYIVIERKIKIKSNIPQI